jgi:hypothetical protein
MTMRYAVYAASLDQLKTQLATAETFDDALRIAADGHPNTTIADRDHGFHYIIDSGGRARRTLNKRA